MQEHEAYLRTKNKSVPISGPKRCLQQGNNDTQETAQRHFYVGGTPTALPSRCSLEALLPWNVKVEDRRRGKLVNVLRAEKITNGVDIRALTAYSAA